VDPTRHAVLEALMKAPGAGAGVLAEFLERPAWQSRAACRGGAVDTFFPERGESLAERRAVCAVCPVRQECLDYALGLPSDPDGVWGGTSQREWQAMRNARRVA
jgi:WhiB family redox-sensing transcriptional regulator